jgi:hypothetical protein
MYSYSINPNSIDKIVEIVKSDVVNGVRTPTHSLMCEFLTVIVILSIKKYS